MHRINRRALILTGVATFAAGPALATEEYEIPPEHQVRIVQIQNGYAPNEIHVDPGQFALYWTLEDGRAIRYPVGIGTVGRYVSGTFYIHHRKNWPSWTPTKAMIAREPHLYAKHAGGMPGGPNNPLGARALYLYKGNRDSMLRIHGTPKPETVGRRISNGCVRMINEHVIDLSNRAPDGTRVVLH